MDSLTSLPSDFLPPFDPLPSFDPSSCGFNTDIIPAQKFEGFALVKTIWRFDPDMKKPRYGAKILVHTSKTPMDFPTCSAAWDCPPNSEGLQRLTSGGGTVQNGICIHNAYPNSEGNIGSTAYLQDGQEVKTPSVIQSYKFKQGQSRLYSFPVMVLASADKLNIPYCSSTPSTELLVGASKGSRRSGANAGDEYRMSLVEDLMRGITSRLEPPASNTPSSRDSISAVVPYSSPTSSSKTSKKEPEEGDWEIVGDEDHITDAGDEFDSASNQEGPQESTASSSRDTIY